MTTTPDRALRPLPRRLPYAAIAVTALALVVTACGSTKAASPTKASYDRQADAICKSYNAKLNSLGSQLTTTSNIPQAEKALKNAVSLANQGTKKLEALPRPTGEGPALSAVYHAQQAQVTELKAVLQGVEAHSQSQVRSALNAGDAANTTLNQKFDALGLTTCGSGTGSSSS